MDLEHARLVLRGEHGLAVDRGRIVREAVAVVLADLESRGDASILVRRLRGRWRWPAPVPYRPRRRPLDPMPPTGGPGGRAGPSVGRGPGGDRSA